MVFLKLYQMNEEKFLVFTESEFNIYCVAALTKAFLAKNDTITDVICSLDNVLVIIFAASVLCSFK